MNANEIKEIYQGLKEAGETDENIKKFINTVIVADCQPKTEEEKFRRKQMSYYSEREANCNLNQSLSATAILKELKEAKV